MFPEGVIIPVDSAATDVEGESLDGSSSDGEELEVELLNDSCSALEDADS